MALLFTVTSPKDRVVALTLIAGDPEAEGASSCRAKSTDAPPAVAVSVVLSAELTADTVAWKVALVAPAATVTEAGTVTAELVLDNVTVSPSVPAAPLSVAVHGSVPAPVMLALLHVRLCTVRAVGCAGALEDPSL